MPRGRPRKILSEDNNHVALSPFAKYQFATRTIENARKLVQYDSLSVKQKKKWDEFGANFKEGDIIYKWEYWIGPLLNWEGYAIFRDNRPKFYFDEDEDE